MAHNSYGLVIEGVYDAAAYSELIQKIVENKVAIHVRVARGVTVLMSRMVAFLRDLENVQNGKPVEKVLVIRDSGGKAVKELKDHMNAKLGNHTFGFPHGYHFCVVVRELETWLLADAQAIRTVALRNGRDISGVVNETLENIADPKQRLERMLQTAKIPYTPELCAEIAREIKLDQLRTRCPSYLAFEDQVRNC